MRGNRKYISCFLTMIVVISLIRLHTDLFRFIIREGDKPSSLLCSELRVSAENTLNIKNMHFANGVFFVVLAEKRPVPKALFSLGIGSMKPLAYFDTEATKDVPVSQILEKTKTLPKSTWIKKKHLQLRRRPKQPAC
eukprot:GHVN01019680.1.p1 GENE.GHVN01019680.1~~GHVN01019680.1.p1  ORF type:complete len:137 (-),score=12.15 GHVN01019680.1:219-629(-)